MFYKPRTERTPRHDFDRRGTSEVRAEMATCRDSKKVSNSDGPVIRNDMADATVAHVREWLLIYTASSRLI